MNNESQQEENKKIEQLERDLQDLSAKATSDSQGSTLPNETIPSEAFDSQANMNMQTNTEENSNMPPNSPVSPATPPNPYDINAPTQPAMDNNQSSNPPIPEIKESSSNNSLFKIAVVVLIIGALAASSYIVYSTIFSPSQSYSTNSNNNTEVQTILPTEEPLQESSFSGEIEMIDSSNSASMKESTISASPSPSTTPSVNASSSAEF